MVDDEVGLQRLVRRRAEREGLEVAEAGTAAEGFVLATTTSPDLILLDLHLPDENGIKLLARLKADPRTLRIPVIAWSGSDAIEGELAAFKAGAAVYLDKSDLRNMMEKILEVLPAR